MIKYEYKKKIKGKNNEISPIAFLGYEAGKY